MIFLTFHIGLADTTYELDSSYDQSSDDEICDEKDDENLDPYECVLVYRQQLMTLFRRCMLCGDNVTWVKCLERKGSALVLEVNSKTCAFSMKRKIQLLQLTNYFDEQSLLKCCVKCKNSFD